MSIFDIQYQHLSPADSLSLSLFLSISLSVPSFFVSLSLFEHFEIFLFFPNY